MKIKLRRNFEGQDSWGAFLEEIAVDPSDLTIKYRRSTGGNCEYGEWGEWENESKALEFMLGPVIVTGELRTHLFAALSKLPNLAKLKMPGGEPYTNYGGY